MMLKCLRSFLLINSSIIEIYVKCEKVIIVLMEFKLPFVFPCKKFLVHGFLRWNLFSIICKMMHIDRHIIWEIIPV